MLPPIYWNYLNLGSLVCGLGAEKRILFTTFLPQQIFALARGEGNIREGRTEELAKEVRCGSAQNPQKLVESNYHQNTKKDFQF